MGVNEREKRSRKGRLPFSSRPIGSKVESNLNHRLGRFLERKPSVMRFKEKTVENFAFEGRSSSSSCERRTAPDPSSLSPSSSSLLPSRAICSGACRHGDALLTLCSLIPCVRNQKEKIREGSFASQQKFVDVVVAVLPSESSPFSLVETAVSLASCQVFLTRHHHPDKLELVRRSTPSTRTTLVRSALLVDSTRSPSPPALPAPTLKLDEPQQLTQPYPITQSRRGTERGNEREERASSTTDPRPLRTRASKTRTGGGR